MTDNEIIKALECCGKAVSFGDCERLKCPAHTEQGCHFYLRTDCDYENTIYIELIKDALDLINRQKTEIERLKAGINIELDSFATEYDNKIKSEAIKEFIDEFERRCINGGIYPAFVKRQLENVKNEMVGENYDG